MVGSLVVLFFLDAAANPSTVNFSYIFLRGIYLKVPTLRLVDKGLSGEISGLGFRPRIFVLGLICHLSGSRVRRTSLLFPYFAGAYLEL